LDFVDTGAAEAASLLATSALLMPGELHAINPNAHTHTHTHKRTKPGRKGAGRDRQWGVAGGFWGYSENEAARDNILIVSLTFLKFVKTKFNLT